MELLGIIAQLSAINRINMFQRMTFLTIIALFFLPKLWASSAPTDANFYTFPTALSETAKVAELRIVVNGKIVAEQEQTIANGQLELSSLLSMSQELIKREFSFSNGHVEIMVENTLIDSIPLANLSEKLVPARQVSALSNLAKSGDPLGLNSSSPSCDAYCAADLRECRSDCAGANCAAACAARYEGCIRECNLGYSDEDGDGFADSVDNCPLISNPGQENCDSDSKGDVCDGFNGTYVVQDLQRCFVEDRSREMAVSWGPVTIGKVRINVRDFWDHHLVDVSACQSPDRMRQVQHDLIQDECYEVNGVGCYGAVRRACEELVNRSSDPDHSWCSSRFDRNYCVGDEPY